LNGHGKAQRSYRLKSDQFLSKGNCIIREFDRLVGETSFPDIAANDKHEFSIGQDSDIVYKENVTLLSSVAENDTSRPQQTTNVQLIRSTYEINLKLTNFKKRQVIIEYTQQFSAQKVTLQNKNNFEQDGSNVIGKFTLAPLEEKYFKYTIELIN